MKQLSFKEYLDSKEKLRESASNIPVRNVTFNVTKYCKLTTGSCKEEKEQLSLKPKQQLIVELAYQDIYNPTVNKISIEDPSTRN